MLPGVCCLLLAVRNALLAVRCALLAVRCLLCVVRCLLFAVGSGLLFVVCLLPEFGCALSPVVGCCVVLVVRFANWCSLFAGCCLLLMFDV